MTPFDAWAGLVGRHQLRKASPLCVQCDNEIAAYVLHDGKRIGLGCIRRAHAKAGVQIGWALR